MIWERAAVICLITAATACTAAEQRGETTGPSVGTSESAASCGVSPLLVPDCGAWFGASTPSADGQYDYVRGLAEYEQVVGVTPDILHFYQRGGRAFPDETHVALAERPGRPRSILLFSWKVSTQLSWREIAEGAADGDIESVAAGLRAYPHTVFLSIHHEPENDVVDDPAAGMTPADYVAMYRHVVSRLDALGVERVVYVMTYMGFERWAPIVDALYPGDDVVDWIAYDPYGFAGATSMEQLLDRPGPDGWPGFYSWATAKRPDAPIMLAEWGFDLDVRPDAGSVIAGAAEVLARDFPMIKAMVYWNDRGERVDGRLGAGQPGGDEFAAAFAELAADPYFALTDTADAP